MATDLTTIRPGMPVFGNEGRRIGTVIEVRADAPEPSDDAGLGSAAPQPDAAGGVRFAALGGIGGKDRGERTDTDIVAQRADVHTVSGAREGTYPAAGADDLLRGYAPPHSGAADAGVNVSGVVRTGGLGAPGSTDPGTGGYVMVSADGAPETSPAGLHVPFTAVREVQAGGVILSCPAAECLSLYGDGRPARRPEDASGLV